MIDSGSVAHADITIALDDKAAVAGLSRLEAEYRASMARIDRMEATAKVNADISDLEVKYKQAQDRLRILRGERATCKIDADKKGLDKEIAEALALIKMLDGKKARVQIETRGAAEAKAQIADITRLEAQRAAAQDRYARQLVRQQTEQGRAAATSERAAMRAQQIEKNAAFDRVREQAQIAGLRVEYGRLTDEVEKASKARSSARGEGRLKAENVLLAARLRLEQTEQDLLRRGASIPQGINVDRRRTIGTGLSSIAGGLSKIGDVRVFGNSLGTVGAVAASLMPVITSLTGALGALVGVVGAGLAGAGALGAGALGGLSLAAGSVLYTLKPIRQAFSDVNAAQKSWTDAVQKFGPASNQATIAGIKYHNVLAQIDPTARKAFLALGKIRGEWTASVGGAAKKDTGTIINEAVKALNANLPMLERNTKRTFGTLATGVGGLFKNLGGSTGRGALDAMFTNFNKTLPSLLRGVGSLQLLLLRIGRDASQYLPHLGNVFANWAGGLNKVTDAKLASGVHKLVIDAEHLGRFFGAATRVLIHFFSGGVGPGLTLMDAMTAKMNAWDASLKSDAGRKSTTAWFADSVKQTRALAGALGPLVTAIGQWGVALQPIITPMATIFGWLTKVIAGFTHLTAMRGPLAAVGTVLATAFAVNKIGALVDGVTLAATRLGILNKERGTSVAIETVETRTLAAVTAERVAETAAAVPEAAAIEGVNAASGGGMLGMRPPGGVFPGAASKLGRFAKGAGIAGVGVLAAQLGGNAIGGKGGTAVSNIGSGAAIGAGIGSIVPGVGTLAGGVAGAALGGLVTGFELFGKSPIQKYADQYGQALGKGMGQGMDKAIIADDAQRLGKAKQAGIDAAQALQAARNGPVARGVPGGGRFSGAAAPTGPTAAAAARALRDVRGNERATGQLLAQHSTQALGAGSTFFAPQVIPGIITSMTGQLKPMSEEMRKGAAEAMIKFTQGLENGGRAAHGTTKALIARIEQDFGGAGGPLATYLRQSGLTATASLAAAMKGDQVASATQGLVDKLKKDFYGMPGVATLTGKNFVSNFSQQMAFLANVNLTSTGPMRKKAEEDMRLLQQSGRRFAAGFTGEIRTMSHNVGKIVHAGITPDARAAYLQTFDNLRARQHDLLIHSLEDIGQYKDNINSIMASELQLLGVKVGGVAIKASSAVTQLPPTPKRKPAQGTYFQIGEAGASGQDNIGVNILAGSGETAAVFTRHQQAVANDYLAPIGGLSGLFSSVDTPHYMSRGGATPRQRRAGGGFVATAYGPPWGGIEGTGITATGVNLSSGQPQYIVAVDPSVIPLHSQLKISPNPFGYSGTFAAEDTGGAIKGNRIDFYDWKGRADQNNWGSRSVNVTIAGHAVGGTATGGIGGGAPAKHIPRGHTKLSGAIGAITQAAMDKMQGNAQSFENAHSGGGTGGGAASTTGLVPQVLAAIAWARGHGWSGNVISGFRTYADQLRIWNSGVRPAARPGTSEHERGRAIDVSDIAGFARAMQSAPPNAKLIEGLAFGDPPHFSTTGHARGGVVRRFATGGPASDFRSSGSSYNFAPSIHAPALTRLPPPVHAAPHVYSGSPSSDLRSGGSSYGYAPHTSVSSARTAARADYRAIAQVYKQRHAHPTAGDKHYAARMKKAGHPVTNFLRQQYEAHAKGQPFYFHNATGRLQPGPAGAAGASILGYGGGSGFPMPTGSAQTPGGWTLDQGVDISAPGGTPLLAVGSGVIVGHGIGGFGPDAPILRLDNGKYVYYGHAGPRNRVKQGTRVSRGSVIGEVGAGIVGISTGPHLEIGYSDANGTPVPGTAPSMAALLHSHYGKGKARGGFVRAARGYFRPRAAQNPGGVAGTLPTSGPSVGSGVVTVPTAGQLNKAKKGPKAKKPATPTERYNPTTGKIEFHTATQWAHINATYQKYKHDHPKIISKRNPITHRIEKRPEWQWHDITLAASAPPADVPASVTLGLGYDPSAPDSNVQRAQDSFTLLTGADAFDPAAQPGPFGPTPSSVAATLADRGRERLALLSEQSARRTAQYVIMYALAEAVKERKALVKELNTGGPKGKPLGANSARRVAINKRLKTLDSQIKTQRQRAYQAGVDMQTIANTIGSFDQTTAADVAAAPTDITNARIAYINAARDAGYITPEEARRQRVDTYGRALGGEFGAPADGGLAFKAALAGEVPTVDTFLQSIGVESPNPNSGGNDVLGRENLAISLAATNDVPLNATSSNMAEHLASLGDNLTAAGALRDTYRDALSQAQATGQSPDIIRSLADSYTSAQSSYQGISDEINNGQLAITQRAATDVINYSTARSDLERTMGSNYAPVWAQNSGGIYAAGSYRGAYGQNLAGVAGPGPSINVTNHFSQPPPDAHTWSQGINWELQAAM